MGRLDTIVHHVPDVNDTIRFIPVVDQALELHVERLASFVNIDSSPATRQFIEISCIRNDDLAVDLEGDVPDAAHLFSGLDMLRSIVD